jgi:hypothetical protein
MLVPVLVASAIACAGSAVLAGTPKRTHKRPKQRVSQIDGSVIDREGAAVANATVVVRSADDDATLVVAARTFELITDETGHFHLDGVPTGKYWFVAFSTAGAATGSTPALPVLAHLVVSIRLDTPCTKA